MRKTILVSAGAALVLMSMVLAPVSATGAKRTQAAAPIPIEVISGVPYLVDADGTQHFLDVYRPTEPGPWPLVLMIHGNGVTGEWLHDWASAVAEQGAVVFVPTWALYFFPTVEEMRAEFQRETGQVACAVRFARGEGETFGGEPSKLTIFGHSAGATLGSVIAFGDPTIPKGCVSRSGSVVPENLVLFEGDFLLMSHGFIGFWNWLLLTDPGVMEDVTPWPYLGEAAPFPTHLFVSDIGGKTVIKAKLDGDPWAADSWLALRDPTGELRLRLQALGAFEDGWLDAAEVHALLRERLNAVGSQASLGVFPHSNHGTVHSGPQLSEEGLQMLVDAILAVT